MHGLGDKNLCVHVGQWRNIGGTTRAQDGPVCQISSKLAKPFPLSVIFINENEKENGEKRENNEFVNEN